MALNYNVSFHHHGFWAYCYVFKRCQGDIFALKTSVLKHTHTSQQSNPLCHYIYLPMCLYIFVFVNLWMIFSVKNTYSRTKSAAVAFSLGAWGCSGCRWGCSSDLCVGGEIHKPQGWAGREDGGPWAGATAARSEVCVLTAGQELLQGVPSMGVGLELLLGRGSRNPMGVLLCACYRPVFQASDPVWCWRRGRQSRGRWVSEVTWLWRKLAENVCN